MEDIFEDLLHLTDLVSPEHTSGGRNLCATQARKDERLLSEDDRMLLNRLAPNEVQEWCLSRITEYRNENHLLREQYSATCDTISKNKCHIRALRAAYNDAAPIHRYLPPEVLMEIFSHVHPAMNTRQWVPVLRVCRYWYRLILRTPGFWANLTLSAWKAWNPRNQVSRFQGALERSSPEGLDLVLPYSRKAMVDVLLHHADRLYALLVGTATSDVGHTVRLLEQTTPRLVHLGVSHRCMRRSDASTFALNLADRPNLQTLLLENVRLHAPLASYAALGHLKLAQCRILSPSAAGDVSALCAVHNALEHFPNLHTLYIIHSLSDDVLHVILHGPPKLTKTVNLPRLRHLEIIDIAAYIPLLLSHLVFPSNTALVLEPSSTARRFSPAENTLVPVFPGINPSPSHNSELTLTLFRRNAHTKYVARWETWGAGVRSVCVTLASYESISGTLLARFTRELAAALAPAPTTSGLTELTLDPFTSLHERDWEQLLPEVPGLRLLSSLAAHSAESLMKVLGKPCLNPLDGESEAFLCARMTELRLGWNIPYATKDEDWEALQLELQDDATDTVTDPVPNPNDKSIDGPDVDAGSSRRRRRLIAAPLEEFSEALRACLAQRAAGRCETIEVLSVFPHWKYGLDGDYSPDVWQALLVGERMVRAVGPLVVHVDTLMQDFDQCSCHTLEESI